MKKLYVIFGVLALVLVLGYVSVSLFQGPAKDPKNILTLQEGELFKGSPDALITIFIYKDFQCPACAYFNKSVEDAWPEIKDYVRVVYRHFPLVAAHKHSLMAASYAEAVRLLYPEAYWSFVDAMYRYQKNWSSVKNPSAFFARLLRSLKIDEQKVLALKDAPEVRAAIQEDLKEARDLGLRGTPSVFMNHIPLDSLDAKLLVKSVLEYHQLLEKIK